jgi:O-antigen ligase
VRSAATLIGPARRYATVSGRLRTDAAAVWLFGGVLAAIVGIAAVRSDRNAWFVIAVAVGVPFALLFANLGVRSLLWWPIVSPLAYPFVRFPGGGNALITLDRVWIPGLAVVILFTPRRRSTRQSRLLIAAVGFLIATFVLRGLASPGSSLTVFKVTLDALVLPFLLLVAARKLIRTTDRVDRMAVVLVVSGVVLAILGIAEKVGGFDLAKKSGGAAQGIANAADVATGAFRIAGPYPWPETYGLSLVICLAATLYWLQLRRTWVLGAFVLALETTAIAFAFFRAIWIAAVIVVIAALGLRPQRFERLVGVVAVVGVALLLISAPLTQNTQFSSRAGNTANINNRLATYATGLEVFASAPVFGVGFNQFAKAETRVHQVVVNGQPPNPFAHNSFIWLLAEQGLFGALPLIIAAFAAFRLLRAYGRRARARADVLLHAVAVGGALAYLVVSLTLTMIPEGPSNAFVAILIGLAAGRLDALAGAEAEPRAERYRTDTRVGPIRTAPK